MDALVADPFELEAEKQKKNIAYIQALTGRLIIELSAALNSLHNTDHSDRYWNILLGSWLERYVCIVFDRYHAIEQAARTHNLTATLVLESADYNLATDDSESAIWACNDDMWNHALCARILQFLGKVEIEYEPFETQSKNRFTLKDGSSSAQLSITKNLARLIAMWVLPRLRREGDAFITSSFLPRWREITLHLLLGQTPQVWHSPPLQQAAFDQPMRQRMRLDNDRHTGFERFVRLQLPDIIPICYVEGYERLCWQVAKLPWPSSPKFIFTSNKFDTDELFKAWTGMKVEQGFPYFIGQHGANYGTFCASDKFLVALTCDKFFTWGWSHGNPQNVPAFIFKIARNHISKRAKKGGLLLIELPPLHRSGLANVNALNTNFDKYQEEQFVFVEALPEPIQKRLMVRLHGEWRKHRRFDESRWKDRAPSIALEAGSAPLQKLIANSRLVVHSYDSTGILETLALNIPTMCFWYDGLDHISEHARPYYELLRKVGIFFDDPEEAAENIALHWDNIDEWWENKELQNARALFCEQYARIELRPVRKLKRLLMEATSVLNTHPDTLASDK
tara:strand:- start:3568 stop:5265 length:1698 start_codon:yes stop_codon:yes gene_type:complete